MSTGCTKFQAHAWKKDLCVNCLQTKNVHSQTSIMNPSASKRPGKSTGGKPNMAFRTDIIRTGPAENGMAMEKPSIAIKPTKQKRQTSDGEQAPAVERAISIDTARTKAEFTETTHKLQSTVSMVEERPALTTAHTDGRRKSGIRSGRPARRPLSPPPQVPNQPPPPLPPMQTNVTEPGLFPSEDSAGTQTAEETVEEIMRQAAASMISKNPEDKHYYHKYDLTQKGQTGTPASTLERTQRKNILIEKFKLTHDTVPTYKEDGVTSQPIAMPYTIVDVSTCPPRDQAPPRLPSTPAPERETGGGSSTTSSRSSHSSSGTSGFGTLEDSGHRHSSSPGRSQSSSPSPQIRHRAMREVREASPLADDAASPRMPVLLHGDGDKQEFKSPTPPRKVPILIQNSIKASHTYEPMEIDDTDDADNGNTCTALSSSSKTPSLQDSGTESVNGESGFMRQSSGRASGTKSAAFEAKMAALSVLNLGVAIQAPAPAEMTSAEQENTEVAEPPQTPPGKRKQKPVSSGQSGRPKETADTKSSKAKKSTKGFFSRLFKLGGGDAEEANDTVTEAAVPEFVGPGDPSGQVVSEVRGCIGRPKMNTDADLANMLETWGGLPPERKSSLDKQAGIASSPQLSGKQKQKQNKAEEPKYKALPVDLKTELLQKGMQSLKQSPKPVRKVTTAQGNVVESSPARKPLKARKPTVAPPSVPVPSSGTMPPPPAPPVSSAAPASLVISAPVAQTQPAELPQGPPPPPPTSPPPSIKKPPKPTKKVSLKSAEITETSADSSKKLSVKICGSVVTGMGNITNDDPPMFSICGDGQATKVLHVDAADTLPESPHSPLSGELSPLSDASGDSEGRTGRTRRSGRKSRSMMGAPPPPPDGGKRCSQAYSSSPTSPKAGTGGSLPSSPTKSLEISAPMPVISQTLPRHSVMVCENESSKYKKKQPGDSAAKHSRNKTVTEGVPILDWDDFALRDGDESLQLDLFDTHTSKFLNRALPDPPTQQSQRKTPPRNRAESEERELDNFYEMVPSERGNSDRGTYEDIDDDDLETLQCGNDGKGKTVGSSHLCPPARTNSLPPSPAPEPPEGQIFPRPTSGEYLEPITHGDLEQVREEDEDETKSSVVTTRSGRPKPSPRHLSGKHVYPGLTEPYVIMYANTDVLVDRVRPALTIPEALAKMAMQNIETLQHITEVVTARHLMGPCLWHEDLRWKQYSLCDSNPSLTQGYTSLYRVRTAQVQPYDGYLMISPRSLPKELCSCNHLHLLHPALLFTDRISAEYFPEPPQGVEVDHYQFYGMVQTNIAVFAYDSVQSLPAYLKVVDQENRNNQEAHHHSLCYILSQVFSAVLYSQDLDAACAVQTIHPRDVLVVTSGGREEKYVVVNNVCQQRNSNDDIAIVCRDLIRLIFYMLNLQRPSDSDLQDCHTFLPSRTVCSRGLKKIVQVLQEATFESLVSAWNMLQFLLWGPSEAEIKSMTLAEKRELAFSMWLEVSRSRTVNKVAMEGKDDLDIRTANMCRYLYSTTGTVLFETTKLMCS